jgi:RNA polymerase sigma-70 factor (ECF subfamily)
MNEKELISGALNDRESYAQIVNLYYKEISNYIYKRTFDKEVAKDLTQETFLRALKYLPSFKGKSSFIFWLLKIATNLINNYYKKEIRSAKLLKNYSKIELNNGLMPIDSNDCMFILDYIKKLSITQQTVITLIFFENKDLQEVAVAIKRSVAVTRIVYYRALDNLRERIEKDIINL